jgi:hypothetical protein
MILALISIISPYLTGVLVKNQIGYAVRYVFSFFGAMLFFIVIKNSHSQSELYNEHIEKLLTLFLFLVSIHILISVSIKYLPALGSIFKIFLGRTSDTLEIYRRNNLERISSFVISYEEYGEILASLLPIALYKYFKYRSLLWLVCIILLSVGEIFSVTRSGIILFIIAGAVTFLYHIKERLFKVTILSYIFFTLFLSFFILNPHFFSDVTYRFANSVEAYKSGLSLVEIINRDDVFLDAWNQTISNISFFGNGVSPFHFHNLFLTTFYEKGVIGACIFFSVLFYPMIRLIKSFSSDTSINKAFIFSCILSMVLFFSNELKFEFTRHSSYQQICWGLFATYYGVSKSHLLSKAN